MDLWIQAVVWGFAALVALAAYRAMTYEDAPAPQRADPQSPETQFARATFILETHPRRHPRPHGAAPVSDLEWRHPAARPDPRHIATAPAYEDSCCDCSALGDSSGTTATARRAIPRHTPAPTPPSVHDLVARDPEIVALLESLAATGTELREVREARERRAARPGLLGTDVVADDGSVVGIREM